MGLHSMKETLRYLMGARGPSGFGSKTTAEQVADAIPALPSSHLTAIITGATSGIGEETARVLAKRGLRLVIPARDLKRGEELRERIQKENPTAEIILLELDLSSFASVQRFCSTFLSLGLPLNILMRNKKIRWVSCLKDYMSCEREKIPLVKMVLSRPQDYLSSWWVW
ncbi:hypothetical protein ACLOJK_032592 [Asimina triloba]